MKMEICAQDFELPEDETEVNISPSIILNGSGWQTESNEISYYTTSSSYATSSNFMYYATSSTSIYYDPNLVINNY